MKSEATLQDWIDSWDPAALLSTPNLRKDLFKRSPSQVRLTEFFGNVQDVEVTRGKISLLFDESSSFQFMKESNESEATSSPSVDGKVQIQDEFKYACAGVLFAVIIFSLF